MFQKQNTFYYTKVGNVLKTEKRTNIRLQKSFYKI